VCDTSFTLSGRVGGWGWVGGGLFDDESDLVAGPLGVEHVVQANREALARSTTVLDQDQRVRCIQPSSHCCLPPRK